MGGVLEVCDNVDGNVERRVSKLPGTHRDSTGDDLQNKTLTEALQLLMDNAKHQNK